MGSSRAVLIAVLLSRMVLFAGVQALVAGGLLLGGASQPWRESAGYWPLVAAVVNIASVVWLWRLTRAEGLPLRGVFGERGDSARRDLLWLLAVLVVAGPIAQGPNIGLAVALWGDAQAPLALFIRPIAPWAAWVALGAFPLTIAVAELPTYYGFVLPRLQRRWGPWKALFVTAAAHSAQHATLPLLFDVRFFTWRLLMFLPFALLVGLAIQRRRSLLPYLMVIHALIDSTVAWMVLETSRRV